MSWFATIASVAAKAVVSYGSEAVAGAAAYNYLHNIQEGCARKGAEYAGSFGRSVCSFAGRVAAGASIQNARDGQQAIAGAAFRAGTAAIDTFQKQPTEAQKSGWGETTWSVAKGFAVAAGSVAVGSALPIAFSALAIAAVSNAPQIIGAFTKEVTNSAQASLVDDVVIPVAKAVAIQAATMAVGNLIRMDVIDTAYKARVEEFTAVGRKVASYVPKCFGSYCEQAGKMAGHVDAGRYAMSDQVAAVANTSAQIGENVVYGGLNVVDAVVPSKPADALTTGWDIARKTAIVGTGVLAAAALTFAAPEIAAVTVGVASFKAAANMITYLRTPAKAEQPKTVEKVGAVVQEQVAFDKDALAAALKPLVTATTEALPMAAAAA